MSKPSAVRAWVLNLDAEHELAERRYTPSVALRAHVAKHAKAVAATLPPGDVVIDPPDTSRAFVPPADAVPVAWCPTPSALRTIAKTGLAAPKAPSLEVLRTVHERGFAFALAGQELPDVLRATRFEQVEAHVTRPGPTSGWLLKRGFGVAGRGQRAVHVGPLTEPDAAWVRASLARGALYVEPRVPIVRELSVHGWVRERVEVRSVRVQHVGADRAFQRSERARGLEPHVERALVASAERVGAALAAAGYVGPFGVDAYEWRSAQGIALRTLSEINPRYCMGWDDEDGWS